MENSSAEIKDSAISSITKTNEPTHENSKSGREKLLNWLNGSLKIKMSDGRVIVGNFFCTDKDSNVILGSSGEYLHEEDVGIEQPRALGLVMVPGRHIVSIHFLL